MTQQDLADILAYCLDSIEQGERTVEECLALYPEHRAELEALLGTVGVIRERADFAPRPSLRLSGRARLLRRLSPRESTAVRQPDRHARRRVRPIFSRELALLWTVLLVLALSLAGVSTAYASGQAIPGDALYPIKLSMEEARLLLSDDAGDVLLSIEFMQRRVAEMQALRDAGREQDLDLVTKHFSEAIARSTESLAAVARDDPGRAAELSVLLETTLSTHAEVLSSQLTTVPEQARPAIERAIFASNRGREVVRQLFEDNIPGDGLPDEIPGPLSTQPAEGRPDDIPGHPSTQPGGPPDEVPGNGRPDGIPGPPSTQPGGGRPDKTPGPPGDQP